MRFCVGKAFFHLIWPSGASSANMERFMVRPRLGRNCWPRTRRFGRCIRLSVRMPRCSASHLQRHCQRAHSQKRSGVYAHYRPVAVTAFGHSGDTGNRGPVKESAGLLVDFGEQRVLDW